MNPTVDDPVASALLGADGPFAREVPNFAPRETQQRMADAVAVAIDDQDTLVVEAGTGTGKTFAYLVPALLSGKRVIVSTGTATCRISCSTATCRACVRSSARRRTSRC